MSATIETYKRRSGTSADLGHKFESDITCLTYVRCLKMYKMNQLKSFKIANNMDHVGAFDDIVCRIEYEENRSLQTKIIFIQTKYKENPIKHAFSNETLISPQKGRKNEKLSPIVEYFKSYLEIKKILGEGEHNEDFADMEKKTISESLRNAFDCKLENAQFVYYTNASEGEMQQFEEIKNTDFVSDILDQRSSGRIYKLKFNDKESSDSLLQLFQKNYPNDIDSVKQFLNNFKVYVSQTSGQTLEENIKHDIKCVGIRNVDIDLIYKSLYDEIKHIFRVEQVPFITEATNYVEKINCFLKLKSQSTNEIEKYNQWSKIYSDESIEKLFNDVSNSKVSNIDYKTLEKSNALVKCLQLAEMFEEINNSFLFLITDKNYFKMWIEVRNLHCYTKYTTSLVCIDNVPEADVKQICSAKVGTREFIVTLSENNHVDEPCFWKQLSNSGRKEIMNYKVRFQSFPSTLGNILGVAESAEILENSGNKKNIDYLISCVLNNEDIIIGSSLPVEDKIYIERKYKKSTKLLTFEAINETDFFILYPKDNIPEYFNVHSATKLLIFETEKEAKNYYFSRIYNNQNIHLCLVDGTYLEVYASKGTLENVLKYQTDREYMNDETFLEHTMNNKCTIISDDVGMGKSTALKRFTHYFKNRHAEYWVEYINLNLQEKRLNILDKMLNTFEAITCFKNMDEVEKMIFLNKCYKDGKVALFFDGFDEISLSSRNNFISMLNALYETKIQTIVISTRPSVVTELKNCKLTFHFTIVPFNYEDMSSYLMKYWSQYVDSKKYEKLMEIVQRIVNQARRMEEILRDIIAVPLQTKMLAETFNKKILNILSSEVSFPSFEIPSLSLYSLYNNFIDMHIDRCMEEKFNAIDDNTSNYEFAKEMFFKRKSGIWEAIACQEMFPEEGICDVTASDIDDLAKQRIGIFVDTDPKTVTFVHRSFAEFLSAKFISKLLFESDNAKHINFFYETILVGKTFGVLRKFLNAVYGNERHWEVTEFISIPSVVHGNILETAVTERNEFLFKVILRHLSKTENILKKLFKKQNDRKNNILHLSAQFCEHVFDDILNSKLFQGAADCNYDGRTALHVACAVGNEIAVKSFLKQFLVKSLSSIINQNDKDKMTPLMSAARLGKTNIVKLLHKHGASLDNKDCYEMNALMMALKDIETVEYLVEHGALVNETNIGEKTALIIAADYPSRGNIVRYLVEKAGANINMQEKGGSTALMYAAQYDENIDLLKFLMQHKADANIVNSFGRTSFMVATLQGAIEVVKYFVELGVDLEAVDFEGNTVVMLAAMSGNEKIMRYFIELGANIFAVDYDGRTILMLAAMCNKIKIFKYFLEIGFDMNALDYKGRTAIMLAAQFRQLDMVKYLMELGAELEKKVDSNGNTCLILCSGQIHGPHMLNYLLEIDSNIDHQNNDGETALLSAASKSNLENLKFLIEKGANVNICNKYGDSALIAVTKHDGHGLFYNLERLINHGAEVNHRNSEGNSALHFATRTYDVTAMKLLVDNGADINLKNNDGITPAMIAQENPEEDVKSYFQKLIDSRDSSL